MAGRSKLPLGLLAGAILAAVFLIASGARASGTESGLAAGGAVSVADRPADAAPSTTTVMSSLEPSTLGAAVTFTATISVASGTPTGMVTFMDSGATLGTGTVSAGVATLTLTTLGVGTHSISRDYSGDGNFAASTSAGLTQMVDPAATTTLVVSSPNPSAPGQSVTFTAFVSGAGGMVSFFDGMTPLGTVSLAAGTASLATSGLAAGNHSITALYGGDGDFAASTSAVLTQTVAAPAPASTLTALISSVDPSVVGQSVSFTAFVSGSAGVPGGTVIFKDGTLAIGVGTLASGVATFTTASLALGSHAITANYTGSTGFAQSSSAPVTQTIAPAPIPGQAYLYQNTLGVTGTAGTDAAHFSNPAAGAVDPVGGHLFIADTGNDRVQVLDTGSLAVIATIGVAGVAGTDNLHLDRPGGVGFDPAGGRIFVADTGNERIQIFDGQTFAHLATLGSTGVAGTGNALFDLPTAVHVDPGTNRLYVADNVNERVQIFDLATLAYVATLGRTGVAGNDNAHFDQPSDAERDPVTNQIMVADTGNARIQLFDATSFAYRATIGVTGAVGSDNSRFALPLSVAFDPTSNLVLVADAGVNDRVQVLDGLTYAYVTTLGSTGSSGIGNNQFALPDGIAIDSAHARLFVGDSLNDRVQIFAIAPVALLASVLPGSRSVELGTTATIFASVINAGAAALEDCGIALPANAPAGLTLSFQTANPATNALTGAPDVPVTIPGGDGVQAFLVALQGTTAFSAPGLALDFDCAGAAPATIVAGVDTIDLALSSTPVADIIALAATPTGNGIVEIPEGGAVAFAVASTNVGVAAQITVSVDTGAATLPVAATICQSSPGTGQCLAPPAATVALDYAAGAAPTFSVFLQSSGAVAFAPGSSRIFVRFDDAGGAFHGSTSVAIETE
jgi:YVTN family beta-propeller protein